MGFQATFFSLSIVIVTLGSANVAFSSERVQAVSDIEIPAKTSNVAITTTLRCDLYFPEKSYARVISAGTNFDVDSQIVNRKLGEFAPNEIWNQAVVALSKQGFSTANIQNAKKTFATVQEVVDYLRNDLGVLVDLDRVLSSTIVTSTATGRAFTIICNGAIPSAEAFVDLLRADGKLKPSQEL